MLTHKLSRFLYNRVSRPFFFKLDPEKIHDRTITLGVYAGRFPVTKAITKTVFVYSHHYLNQTIHDIDFKNPVGLSAGFDKDAHLVNILPSVGFGFAQFGSVTLHPYEGNPGTRLYRLNRSKAIVVYYGLKSVGVEKFIKNVQKSRVKDFPIGISIAKTNSKETVTDEEAINDYYQCLNRLVDEGMGDFYTINISCPNTFGGEPFTSPEKLDALLNKLLTLNINKPVFIKMPSNLMWPEFKSLLDVSAAHKVNGVVIANLNKDRDHPAIRDEIPEHIQGSISGKPTWDISNDLISKTYTAYGERLTIIGVGGIFSADDAYEKIKLGASLVQLITGMIYEGPQLIGEINCGLVELLKQDGYSNISEAIGAHHKS